MGMNGQRSGPPLNKAYKDVPQTMPKFQYSNEEASINIFVFGTNAKSPTT